MKKKNSKKLIRNIEAARTFCFRLYKKGDFNRGDTEYRRACGNQRLRRLAIRQSLKQESPDFGRGECQFSMAVKEFRISVTKRGILTQMKQNIEKINIINFDQNSTSKKEVP